MHAGLAPAEKKALARKFEQTPLPQPLPDLIYDFSGLAE
jgi:hypothetical protein